MARRTKNIPLQQVVAEASPKLFDTHLETAVERLSPSDARRVYMMSQPRLDFDRKTATFKFRQHLQDSKGVDLLPKVGGIHSRTQQMVDGEIPWRNATDRHSNILKNASNRRVAGKIADETDILNSYWGYRGIIQSEYDLLEPYTLLDVEAIYCTALRRMQSLIFRNGIDWVGENPSFVEYTKRRTDQLGFMMKQTFEQFLREVYWNLLVCSNCIVSKVRDNEASGGTKSERNDNLVPVAAYMIVPPHTIFPFLDGHGHIAFWRRFYKDGRPYRDYPVEDIIHFKWDVKPGHIYGTPRATNFRDDIYALRRLEENIELLLVHHLFPLFHVKVGTEKEPVEYFPDGSGSEIDVIRAAIMNMPKEGVFVTDYRVEVDVKGAQGQGVDPMPILAHFKSRLLIGMGVSSIDVGEASGSLASADNVSQNLKDRVKADMHCFNSMVKHFILREMFEESPTKVSVQKAVSDVSIAISEIDTDGQVKMETHAANLLNNHILDQDEARKRTKLNPLTKEQEKKTHFQKHVVGLEKVKQSHALQLQEKQAEVQVKTAAITAAAQKTTTTKKANSKTGSSTTKTTTEPTSHGKQALSNIVQPANQHGKNLDPHKARSSQDPRLVQTLYDGLLDIRESLAAKGDLDLDTWREASSKLIDRYTAEDPTLAYELKQVTSLSHDDDLLHVLLRAAIAMADKVDAGDGIIPEPAAEEDSVSAPK